MRNRILYTVTLFLMFSSSVLAQNNWLFLSAATQYISIGDLDVTGNQLTVEALITWTGGSLDILSKHNNPADVNYLLRPNSFEITTTSGYKFIGGPGTALNVPYHLAATYDGTTLRYYRNGCLVNSMAWTGTMAQNNWITKIGNIASNNANEQFLGYIDELRVWNVARTEAQIQANMFTLPTPTTQIGLLAYYNFDTDYLNQQGNAAWNGTAVGAATRIANPFWTGGLGGAGVYTWNGNVSIDWFNPCNWTPSTVPGTLSDVVIPAAPTNPPTIGAVGAICQSIEIQGATVLTITPTANGLDITGP